MGAPTAGAMAAERLAGVQNVVLVHGAWADGSSWNKVIDQLQRDGYRVTAAQIPFNSMSEDVERVRRVLAYQDGPTILAGHSFGGAVITRLGPNPPNVAGLVYVAAFAPDKGESMKAIAGAAPQPVSAGSMRPDPKGYVWLDRSGFLKYFAPDLDVNEANVLASVQKPIASSELMDDQPFDEPAWRSVPSWYLLAEQDQMIPPTAQRAMAQRAHANITSVPSSHVVMLSHPIETADVIRAAARSVRGRAG